MSDGFLSRWAQRKRDVRLSERAVPPPVAAEPVEVPAVSTDEAPVPDEAAAEAERDLLAELPALEDLTAETDLTPFLRTGVPTALRNAALRRIWSVDPAIRDFVSEAREYAYDWNTPGGVPGLGPLLPSDDVKAMLGRMFNRDPSETDSSDPIAIEADQPDAAVQTASEDVLAPESPGELPDPKLLTEAMPPNDPANSPENAAVTSSKTVATARLRRHGGAMPS